ncbi:MAG: type II secretion system protein [Phycisphaerae bacterium]
MGVAHYPYRRLSQTGFTLLELLIVIAIIALLVGIVSAALSSGRDRGRAVKCLTNLHGVGQLITSFAGAHDDNVAPVIRDRDTYWDRGKQIGWDIHTGRWAKAPGGPRTVWQCPISARPYVGNSRALGLDNREALDNGLLHLAGPRRWYEASRLVLAYDVQPNIARIAHEGIDDPIRRIRSYRCRSVPMVRIVAATSACFSPTATRGRTTSYSPTL